MRISDWSSDVCSSDLYDEGVYAIPGEAAYVGTFTYFGQPTEEWAISAKGSFIVVGKRLNWDGTSDTGFYIAAPALVDVPVSFTKPPPESLHRFESPLAPASRSHPSPRSCRSPTPPPPFNLREVKSGCCQ